MKTKNLVNSFAIATSALAFMTGASLADDLKIALVPGSPHPYFQPWEEAAKDAMKDFGIGLVEVRVPAERKLNLQVELLESLLSQGYTGFGLFPGDAGGINPTLQELTSNGATALSLAGCTLEPTTATFCLSADFEAKTYEATKELIKLIGGEGTIVDFSGPLIDPNVKPMLAAIEKAVAETNGKVKILQHVMDTDELEKGDQKINAFLAAHKDEVDGIIATGYASTQITAKALRNLGDKRIKMVGETSEDPIVIDAMKEGFVSGSILLNAYAQGYVGAYAIQQLQSGNCKIKDNAPFKKTMLSSRFIDSATTYIDAKDAASYKDVLKSKAKELQASFKDTYLACN